MYGEIDQERDDRRRQAVPSEAPEHEAGEGIGGHNNIRTGDRGPNSGGRNAGAAASAAVDRARMAQHAERPTPGHRRVGKLACVTRPGQWSSRGPSRLTKSYRWTCAPRALSRRPRSAAATSWPEPKLAEMTTTVGGATRSLPYSKCYLCGSRQATTKNVVATWRSCEIRTAYPGSLARLTERSRWLGERGTVGMTWAVGWMLLKLRVFSGLSRSSLRAYETGLVGSDDQLRAIPRAELHQQPANVGFCCGQADMQLFGDLGVGSGRRPPGSALRARVRWCQVTGSAGAATGCRTNS